MNVIYPTIYLITVLNTQYVNLFALESKLTAILRNSQESLVNWRHLEPGSPKIDKE
jgi:hypothetical protein